jgi:hypothetical protein
MTRPGRGGPGPLQSFPRRDKKAGARGGGEERGRVAIVDVNDFMAEHGGKRAAAGTYQPQAQSHAAVSSKK